MRLTQAKLAESLGITQSAVSQLAARGMPRHSVEAARAWRSANLNPSKTKSPPLPPRPPHLAELLAQAEAHLEAGDRITGLLPAIRAALRQLPAEARADLKMSVKLWGELVAPVARAFADCEPQELADAEAADLGEFWFAVAAGEVFVP